ncbi:TPA: HGGxSTG domain-containing protein [Photobacterium damselae]
MSTRFDLNSLPLCNAKTRQGTLCKRRGNLRNGRCKLHGGNSTGAKTEKGKMASRINARKLFPSWYFGEKIPSSYYYRATNCFNQLRLLVQNDPIDWPEIYRVIEPNIIPLEMLKYFLLELLSPIEFIMIQHLLDAYYSEKNAEHLNFTIYQPQWVLFGSQPELNTPKKEFISQWRLKNRNKW